MLQHITTALGKPHRRADREPVRRHSLEAGRCEGVFWSRTDCREMRLLRLIVADAGVGLDMLDEPTQVCYTAPQ